MPAIPFINELRYYRGQLLRYDLLAALTVAIVALPQSMAYALIAGVDPIYGLYTAIICAIVGSFFGSSNHLVTGPTNAIALMIAGAMKNHTDAGEFYQILFLLTFLVGLIQLALGVLKVGKIINYVSHSVIVGFTAGAGIIIGLGQLNELLGISLARGYHPLYAKVGLVLRSLDTANVFALALGGLTVALILVCKKISRNIPGSLIGLIICAAAASAFNLDEKGVRLVGSMPGELPVFKMLSFSFGRSLDLFGSALAIAIVGLVEAISIAKSIALSSEQKIRPNQEFIGQGMANIIGSFFRCFPASGSFTRSAINYDAQAKTKMAGILSGVIVAVVLLFFAPYARYIPNASLAGVIIVVAYGMVNKTLMRKIIRTDKSDAAVMFITLGATVIMPDLERAIMIGIAVSFLTHLWHTGEIKLKLLHPDHGSGFRENELDAAPGVSSAGDIPIIHIEGNLYFGSAGDLDEKLEKAAGVLPGKVIILRLKRINGLDISAFEIIDNFIDKTLRKGKIILLCGVTPAIKAFFDKTGITRKVGAENIFLTEEKIYASCGKAYQRAQALAGQTAGANAGSSP